MAFELLLDGRSWQTLGSKGKVRGFPQLCPDWVITLLLISHFWEMVQKREKTPNSLKMTDAVLMWVWKRVEHVQSMNASNESFISTTSHHLKELKFATDESLHRKRTDSENEYFFGI